MLNYIIHGLLPMVWMLCEEILIIGNHFLLNVLVLYLSILIFRYNRKYFVDVSTLDHGVVKIFEFLSPCLNHWIRDFCLHSSSYCLWCCSSLISVVPSSATNFGYHPSRIILCCISSIFCSKSILCLKILLKTCLFHFFILVFKAFNLSWKIFILDVDLTCSSSHHLFRRSTKKGS